MALTTYYIENRDYTAKEVVSVINNYNTNTWGKVAYYCFGPLLIIASYILDQEKNAVYTTKDATDVKYSGVELTNFINAFSKLNNTFSKDYVSDKDEIVNKLFNHEYNTPFVLTQDETGYFSWPGAVLLANKEEVMKNFSVEIKSNDMVLVDNEMQTSDIYHN